MARKLTSIDKEFLKFMVQKSDDPATVMQAEYNTRLRANDDEATVILVGHLIIENLLDKIIRIKCKSPKKILDDHITYCFAVKLQIVYSMGLLPDDVYKNILRINMFRNKFSHNIEFNIDPNIMVIDLNGEKFPYLDAHPEDKKKKNLTKKYLDTLCVFTLSDLSKHMVEIGIDIRYKSDAAL